MPATEPCRAWATFQFTGASGRIDEWDALIAVPGGLCRLELKGHPGRVVNHDDTWQFLRGLPDDGTPVHRPGGLLRHLLRGVPAPPDTRTPAPDRAVDRIPGPRLSSRLTGARECEGQHVQPMLFRPLNDETLCPRCTG